MTGRRAFGLCAALAVAGAIGWRVREAALALPAELRWQELVRELSDPFEPTTVAVQRVDAPVRVAIVRTGPEGEADAGAPRRAVVAPAPARLRWPVAVPPQARLLGAVTVGDDSPRGAGPVRFEVRVDDRVRFTRTIDRAAGSAHRRWIEIDVDLAAFAGQEVMVELATAAIVPADPPGMAAWAHVRIVCERARSRQPASGGPNVLLVVVDTLRADRVGGYGAGPSRTPVLDELAARGTLFTESTAQSSWTLLSVPSILTGLHPRSHGVWGEMSPTDTPAHLDTTYLADEITTIAESAAGAGISTLAVVTNPLVSRSTNMLQGFESIVEYGQKKEFDPAGATKAYAPARVVNDTFRTWLRRNAAHRFFAYLHYMEPHGPYEPWPEFRPAAPSPPVSRAALTGQPMPFVQRMQRGGAPPSAAEVAYLAALYDGDVRSWDAAFGELVQALAEQGVLDRTIVVVTADHGEEFLEHGQLRHGTQLYDETTRVPLVLVGPGIPIGRVASQAQGIDVYPTIAARLGLPLPNPLPGRDLLGTGVEPVAISELAIETASEQVSARTPRGKWIEKPAHATGAYFDLEADPGEHVPNPPGPASASLRASLETWRRRVAKPPTRIGREGADPAALREKLRALGYLD